MQTLQDKLRGAREEAHALASAQSKKDLEIERLKNKIAVASAERAAAVALARVETMEKCMLTSNKSIPSSANRSE